MVKKLLIVICISLMSSCSRDGEVVRLSQKFFDAYDHGDFKQAYSMLSSVDKRCSSMDSFCTMAGEMESQIARLGSSSAISMFIVRTDGDTSWVRQVWRVPDYALINRVKPQNEKFSDYFAMLESGRAVPVRLDSSRVLCIVRENGAIKVYLGLDRFQKFTESYHRIKGSYSFFIIVHPESIVIHRDGRGHYSARALVRITNYSPFLVSGFECSISIDKKILDSNCTTFAMTEVPSGRSVAGPVQLSATPFLQRKWLAKESSTGRIEGDRIMIIPTRVYFGTNESAFLRKMAMRESGFGGFTFLAPGYSKALLDF